MKVVDAMQRSDISQLNQLVRVKGIGIKTLEKLFSFASNDGNLAPKQLSLFDTSE
jgi:hypothetical protein